jgi:hypothetical protein
VWGTGLARPPLAWCISPEILGPLANREEDHTCPSRRRPHPRGLPTRRLRVSWEQGPPKGARRGLEIFRFFDTYGFAAVLDRLRGVPPHALPLEATLEVAGGQPARTRRRSPLPRGGEERPRPIPRLRSKIRLSRTPLHAGPRQPLRAVPYGASRVAAAPRVEPNPAPGQPQKDQEGLYDASGGGWPRTPETAGAVSVVTFLDPGPRFAWVRLGFPSTTPRALRGGRCGPQAQDPADRTTAAGSRPGAEYGSRHGDTDPKAPERKSLPRPADRASLRRNARPPPRRPWLPPPLPSPQHQLGRSNLAWLVDKKTLYTVQWVFAPTIAKSTRAFRSSTSGQTEDLL